MRAATLPSSHGAGSGSRVPGAGRVGRSGRVLRRALPPAAAIARAPALRQQQLQQLLELRPGEVLYFAYGSNMAPSTLTGRRGVRPRASVPATARSLRLSFAMLGFPFSEPAFATVVPPGHPLAAGGPAAPPAHGVLHVLSAEGWQKVCRSEGVGSASAGYRIVEVECEAYPSGGSSISSSGNGNGISSSGTGGSSGGVSVRALTLQGADVSLHTSARGALPSPRYLSLIRQGAAHHGLDPSYQSYLATLEAYTPPPAAGLGALASAGAALAAAGPAVPLVAAARLLGGNSSSGNGNGSGSGSGEDEIAAAFSEVGAVAMQVTWAAHDALISGVLGSGCRNGTR